MTMFSFIEIIFFFKKKNLGNYFVFLLMIPSVLLKMIDNYNEVGVFILLNDCIFWFNGKRIEYWCLRPQDCDRILTYKFQLYYQQIAVSIRQTNNFIYKNGKFRKINIKHLAWNHPLVLLFRFDQQVNINGNVYLFDHKSIDRINHINRLDMISRCPSFKLFVFKMMAYKSFIYYFFLNEKQQNCFFDINTLEWHNFKNFPFPCDARFYLFQDNIYIIKKDFFLRFDPIINSYFEIICNKKSFY